MWLWVLMSGQSFFATLVLGEGCECESIRVVLRCFLCRLGYWYRHGWSIRLSHWIEVLMRVWNSCLSIPRVCHLWNPTRLWAAHGFFLSRSLNSTSFLELFLWGQEAWIWTQLRCRVLSCKDWWDAAAQSLLLLWKLGIRLARCLC